MSTKIFFVFCFFQEITFFAHLVGSGLNKLFQLKTQSCIFAKSLFNLEAETLALFTTEKREVSSANSLALVVRPRGRSLMSVRKNNGSRIEPCGTPAVTNFQTEDWLLRTRRWHLLLKNDLISLNRLLSIVLLLSL